MLLEIFSFRLHHIQPHFRLTMLNHLQVGLGGGMQVAITKNFQLNLCLESTALRLITGEYLLRLQALGIRFLSDTCVQLKYSTVQFHSFFDISNFSLASCIIQYD